MPVTEAAIGIVENVRRNPRVVILVLLMPLFFTGPGFCEETPRLTNIIVTNTRDDLLLYLNVEGAFHKNMESTILSGVPTSFSFKISLFQVRGLWMDKTLVQKEEIHTIKYDPLKKEYVVRRSWDETNPNITRSFDEAQQWMTEINGLRLIPLDVLEKGRQYQIRAKAELDKVTLPFYLHYIIFFLSLWDFETDWYSIDFIY
jgi:hypothetical protein